MENSFAAPPSMPSSPALRLRREALMLLSRRQLGIVTSAEDAMSLLVEHGRLDAAFFAAADAAGARARFGQPGHASEPPTVSPRTPPRYSTTPRRTQDTVRIPRALLVVIKAQTAAAAVVLSLAISTIAFSAIEWDGLVLSAPLWSAPALAAASLLIWGLHVLLRKPTASRSHADWKMLELTVLGIVVSFLIAARLKSSGGAWFAQMEPSLHRVDSVHWFVALTGCSTLLMWCRTARRPQA